MFTLTENFMDAIVEQFQTFTAIVHIFLVWFVKHIFGRRAAKKGDELTRTPINYLDNVK